jgi:hypothetical protein
LDAFKVPRTLDRVFARVELAAAHAPRPYRYVILSDHGQSMGVTLKQRYGQTLPELVTSLISFDSRVNATRRPSSPTQQEENAG